MLREPVVQVQILAHTSNFGLSNPGLGPVDKSVPKHDLMACFAWSLPSILELGRPPDTKSGRLFLWGFLNPATPAGGFPPEP